jgi:hypothetical protein
LPAGASKKPGLEKYFLAEITTNIQLEKQREINGKY